MTEDLERGSLLYDSEQGPREGMMNAMVDARQQLDATLERETREYSRASEIIEATGGPRLDPFDLADLARLGQARQHFHWVARGIIAGLEHAQRQPRRAKAPKAQSREPQAGDVVRSIQVTLEHASGVRTITNASGWGLEAAAQQAEALAAKYSGEQVVTSIMYEYHSTILLPEVVGGAQQ